MIAAGSGHVVGDVGRVSRLVRVHVVYRDRHMLVLKLIRGGFEIRNPGLNPLTLSLYVARGKIIGEYRPYAYVIARCDRLRKFRIACRKRRIISGRSGVRDERKTKDQRGKVEHQKSFLRVNGSPFEPL